MDLETNMKMVGKRFPYYAKYKVRTTLVYNHTRVQELIHVHLHRVRVSCRILAN